MSKPSGNKPLNIRNLPYFQSLRSGQKLDPVRVAEAFDDISNAFAALTTQTAATGTTATGGTVAAPSSPSVISGTASTGGSTAPTSGNPITTPDTSSASLLARAAAQRVFVTEQLQSTAQLTSSSGPISFSSILSGENTQAIMVVGEDASLTWDCTSNGIIQATELATDTCTSVATNLSTPQHAGQVLISQPGNATAVWADPYVQGVFPPGTDVDDANPGSPPAPINPVLVGAENPEHLLENLNLDEYGNLLVNDGLTFTAYGSPAEASANVFVVNPVTISGTIVTSNASVGLTEAAAPTSATEIGFIDPSGNLIAPSEATPLPVSTQSWSDAGNSPIVVSVGTSSTTILNSNLLRRGCNLVNMSLETISLAFGNVAVLYQGVTLGPGGTFWMDAFDFTTNSITAISTNTAMGGYLGVQEYQ